MTSQHPHQIILTAAQSWHNEGHYKEAVILAQTALELFTEKTLGQLYSARGVDYLKPVFEQLLTNYNLANKKVSALYVALSGDEIRQASFWSSLQAHAELRNQLVHDGQDATIDQSRQSLDTVKTVMDHVQAVVPAR